MLFKSADLLSVSLFLPFSSLLSLFVSVSLLLMLAVAELTLSSLLLLSSPPDDN